MLSFGALIIAVVSLFVMPLDIDATQSLIQLLAMIIMAGLFIEGTGYILHAWDMKRIENEGAASHYRQATQYGKSYILRNVLLGLNIALAIIIAMIGIKDTMGLVLGVILVLSMLVMGAIGRSLFFVLVIPTTMPGAFFWKNQGFVDHARETGLAEMQQVGVVYERHHEFKVDELIKTIKENSIKDMITHVRWIFGGK